MVKFRSLVHPGQFRGYTLIEVTVVITVLLGLISSLLIGVQAFKRGSDRALCIQNIANVQRAVRVYGNLNELFPGTSVPNLRGELIGTNKLIPRIPVCPAGGLYTFGPNVLPQIGTPYLSCSVEKHAPKEPATW